MFTHVNKPAARESRRRGNFMRRAHTFPPSLPSTAIAAAAIASAALAPAAVSTSAVASAAITTPSRLQQPLLT